MSPTTPTTVNQAGVRRRRAEREAPAHGVAPRPEAAGHRRVDDCHARRAASVGGGEGPSATQRRPQRVEDAAGDFVAPQGDWLRAGPLAALRGDELLADVADEQLAADAGAFDARDARDAIEDRVVEAGALRLGKIGRRRDVQRHHAFGPEPGVDAAHVPPAAQEQAGAREQDDGRGALADDEQPAEPGRRTGRGPASAVDAGDAQVPPPRRDDRRQADQQPGDGRHRDRPGEHAEVETDVLEARDIGRPERRGWRASRPARRPGRRCRRFPPGSGSPPAAIARAGRGWRPARRGSPAAAAGRRRARA